MWVEYYLRSSADHPPLKIGLLLDGLTLAGPFAEVLKHIQASNFAAIHLLVLNAEATPPANPQPRSGYLSRALRLLQDRRRRQGLLFDWYERWDRRCQPEAARALAPVDCSALLRGVERLEVTPQRKGFVQRFPPEALVAIREKDLDVLLRFGFGILRGDILHCARYGVWSYHHGDNDYYRGGPAHFWELYERNPLSGVMLQVLTEQLDAGRVLCRAFLATEPGLSLVRNRLRPYLTAVPFVIAKLLPP